MPHILGGEVLRSRPPSYSIDGPYRPRVVTGLSPPGMGLLGLGRVQAKLEEIVGSRVDLVPAGDLKPGVRARADRDLVAL